MGTTVRQTALAVNSHVAERTPNAFPNCGTAMVKKTARMATMSLDEIFAGTESARSGNSNARTTTVPDLSNSVMDKMTVVMEATKGNAINHAMIGCSNAATQAIHFHVGISLFKKTDFLYRQMHTQTLHLRRRRRLRVCPKAQAPPHQLILCT